MSEKLFKKRMQLLKELEAIDDDLGIEADLADPEDEDELMSNDEDEETDIKTALAARKRLEAILSGDNTPAKIKKPTKVMDEGIDYATRRALGAIKKQERLAIRADKLKEAQELIKRQKEKELANAELKIKRRQELMEKVNTMMGKKKKTEKPKKAKKETKDPAGTETKDPTPGPIA